jgi:hypothetical protein
MASADDLKAALILTISGCALYYVSFVKNKLRRKLSDTPRSKIKSAAMGTNVEVAGKVLNMAEDGVISPLSGTKGAAFIWILEEDVLSGPDTIWEPLCTFYSTPYLYIHDEEEHIAAIDLSACEFQENIFQHKTEFNTESFSIPDQVKNIFDKSSMLKTSSAKSFFSSNDYRIREKVFTYEEPIYALGAAVPCPDEETPMNPGPNKKLVLDGKSLTNEYAKRAKLLITIDNSASELIKVSLSTRSEDRILSLLRKEALFAQVGSLILIAAGLIILFK